eukprot:16389-Pelagomonas_calceolata.AAC.1
MDLNWKHQIQRKACNLRKKLENLNCHLHPGHKDLIRGPPPCCPPNFLCTSRHRFHTNLKLEIPECPGSSIAVDVWIHVSELSACVGWEAHPRGLHCVGKAD